MEREGVKKQRGRQQKEERRETFLFGELQKLEFTVWDII